MTKATPKTRQTKTPRQRAEEALGVARRAVERLSDKYDALLVEVDQVADELKQAVRRRDYLAAHPDLGDPQQLEIPVGGEEE